MCCIGLIDSHLVIEWTSLSEFIDSHGRGLFIARKYIDRLIVNIDQKRKTEIIIINYFENTYKGFKPLYINEI